MDYPYLPPLGGPAYGKAGGAPVGKPYPAWEMPAAKAMPGWAPPGWTPPPPGWSAPAGKAPTHPYGPTAEYGRPGEPVSLELMAIIESSLSSVIPAILGLLQISGMLLSQPPMGPDMPGPEPTELTPGEPSPISFGMGHLGLFGPLAEGRAEDPAGPEAGTAGA